MRFILFTLEINIRRNTAKNHIIERKITKKVSWLLLFPIYLFTKIKDFKEAEFQHISKERRTSF